MLKHSIIVFKPTVVQFPVAQRTWQPPCNLFPPERPKRNIKTQEEYDAYLANTPWTVGDFLVLDKNPVMQLTQIHLIIDMELKFENVTWQMHTGTPKAFHLLQLGQHVCAPWQRWDDISDYRQPSDSEYETFIAKNFDSIQNYCQQHARYTPPARTG